MMASVVATAESITTTARQVRKTRKRASKACLSCRARKVRCDVSQRGRPCMNCYLDSDTCIVTSRASKFRKAEREVIEDSEASGVLHPPDTIQNRRHETMTEGAANSEVNVGAAVSEAGFLAHVNDSHTVETVQALNVSSFAPEIHQEQQSYHTIFNGFDDPSLKRPLSTIPEFNAPPQSFGAFANSESGLWTDQLSFNAHVTYSYYPFLAVNNMHNVLPQDVNFLESQGCLRVPTREILDEFMQQYFLHVHPLMPFLNEGDFWNLYCYQDNVFTGERMSLLVFQAMLFSCCNFVSKTSIRALGFPNIRSARATLYRRTKLLYDFDTESCLISLAQASLLLTYYAPNWSLAAKKPNTAWLGVAVHNAKSAEAHTYSAMPPISPVTDPIDHKKQNTLKRLWWCCVFRDRLLGLGMRRCIQIPRAHFDFDTNSFGFSDLSDEVGQSKVYNAETKKHLIEIFVQLGKLCSVMTDLLTLVFPLDDGPGWGRYNEFDDTAKIRDCKVALRRWYKATTLRFPVFGGRGAATDIPTNQHHHDSVILYTNLLYMWYHSARAALYHHEVLQEAMASASPHSDSNLRGVSNIRESRSELQDAASGVTECLNELIQRGLARWLPISAIACTAMPLVLHIIDVKLSSHNKRSGTTPGDKRRTMIKQQRLNVLIEAMKTYQPQYDGVDYVSETIRHIVNLAQIDSPSGSGRTTSPMETFPKPVITDWTDLLASDPGSYLLLSMTMDISISKGRLAKETDFPIKLRGLFAHGLSSIREFFGGGHSKILPTSTSFATASPTRPSPVAQMQLGSVHSISSEDSSASPDSVEEVDKPIGALDERTEQVHEPGSAFLAMSLLEGATEDRDVSMHTCMHDDIFADIDYALTVDALVADVSQSHQSSSDQDRHNGQAVICDEGNTSDAPKYDHTMGDDTAGDIDKEVSWMENVWDVEETYRYTGEDEIGDASDGGVADKETARVLLDALKDSTVSSAMRGKSP
ncbi:hypothetical protein F4808DRAFT_141790 [Astrocystis sublimbata]|nr:hypothetical protein F4808DRAFT_141790 [Astrocystis sublimbata]